MDWDTEGLLEGVDGDARTTRIVLLDALHAEGVALEELRVAAREDRLVLLPLERTIAGRPRFTIDEVAAQAGFDRDTLLALRRRRAHAPAGRPAHRPPLRHAPAPAHPAASPPVRAPPPS